jgi:hypothetical protein
MKTIFTCLSVLFYTAILSQNYYMITFDGTGVNESNPGHKLIVDTSLWQIDIPQKTVFTSTVSPTKAIVTKTLTTYPVNKTSFFSIKHVADFGFAWNIQAGISGKYFVNSDTLSDFGTIEFSPDNGTSWINLVTNTTYSTNIFWNNPYTKPVLTGNSSGWKQFKVNIEGLGPTLGIQYGDTVIYRFGFTSDATQTNKDGLMYDSIYVFDYPPLSVKEISGEQQVLMYPNPAKDVLILDLQGKTNPGLVTVYNSCGKAIIVSSVSSSITSRYKLDIKDLSSGFYSWIITGEQGERIGNGKFIKAD